jgi:deoxyribose-phosphate aldolase
MKYEEAFAKFDLNLQDEDVSRKTATILEKFEANNTPEVRALLYSCIDLTSLNTEDSKEKIWKFAEEVNNFDGSKLNVHNVAAICVYPNFVQTLKEVLTADVRIASVAAGFPASQTFVEVKIAEVSLAVTDGADEIDIVLNVGAFFEEEYESLSEEILEIKSACRDARLKVILETGLLKTASNIQKASILSLYSGADFLKTSTGKVYPGANPEAVYVMCQAIKEYNRLHNRKVGIKVSGGVRTTEDAVKYYTIVKEVLGTDWLNPDYFRIGASSLANNLIKTL